MKSKDIQLDTHTCETNDNRDSPYAVAWLLGLTLTSLTLTSLLYQITLPFDIHIHDIARLQKTT